MTQARRPTGPRKFHFNLPLTLICLVMLGILLYLGTWQASRYQESTTLAEFYHNRHVVQPALDNLDPKGLKGDERAEEFRFRRIEVEGELVVEDLQLLTARYKFAKPGFGVLVPLKVAGAPFEKILVYLGWVPRDRLEEFLNDLKTQRKTTIKGRLNKGDAQAKTHEPVGERFGFPTWRNTNLQTLSTKITHLDPDLLIQSGEEATGKQIDLENLPLDGYRTPLKLSPSKHVEYSITWYGIAFALVVIYLLFAFRRTHRPEDLVDTENAASSVE